MTEPGRRMNPTTMSSLAEHMAEMWDADWIMLLGGDFDSESFDVCVRVHPRIENGAERMRERFDDALAFLKTVLDREPHDSVPDGLADVVRIVSRLTSF